MIERCKRNKAKRDPNGAMRIARRKANKERRARRKAHARRMKERALHDAEILKAAREMPEGLGWGLAPRMDFAAVEQRVNAWVACEGLAIQQGKPLAIDNYLQGRLMG
ncbi:hypothetical protein DEAOPOFO_00005 [Klebsiella phage 066058]|nr:hypothetical protein DEAOPOFO_00005 [Klebsiella phage 066058]